MKVAGAPISWGVCEAPDWGHQLRPERVFAEMAELGITATEFGPDGYLPAEPVERGWRLGAFGLRAVGGFVPVVLHDPGHDPRPALASLLDRFVAAGADVLILAAATGASGYDARPELDRDGLATLCANLDGIAELAASRGLRASVHPHVGTMIERRDEVEGVLAGSAIPLCLDTGHLLVGGTDPVELARTAGDRIGHVHLKDVDAGLAEQVRSGERAYTDAVRDGLFRPLGGGDVAIGELLKALTNVGYDGWYVLEQDVMLDAEPAPGAGPRRDVAVSLRYLSEVAETVGR